MKKLIVLLAISFQLLVAAAQQTQGKVMYERVSQLMIRINDSDPMAQNIPRSRTDKFELLFGNNQSFWHLSDEETPPEEGPGPGIQIRMVGGGTDDISFYDFSNGTVTEQHEMFDKKFIISDSIQKMNWKLTGETKTILGHPCQRASSQRIAIRTMMSMDNGKLQRKELPDTSLIIAWFAADIPIAAGPAEYQGQLPGLILELDLHNGRQVFKAIEIAAKADLMAIRQPKSGKKVTREQFRQETQKMMEEMENNQGGNRVMRFNN